MTVQLHPSEPASSRPPGAASKVGVTELEHTVLKHLTAAWNAFLQLPTERVEYIVAFQEGCQHLQKQILERGENRSGVVIEIPPLEGSANLPVLTVTVEERARRRSAKHNATAKARRARQLAEDPEAVRAKEREKWHKRKARLRTDLAASGKAKGATHIGGTREPSNKTTRTEAIRAPKGLSQADRVRWRYNNDPVFREHVRSRNLAYQQQRRANGQAAKKPPKTEEQKARDRERQRFRLANEPAYAEAFKAKKRASNARYKAALRALSQSTTRSGETRLNHLRSDPLYAAAHAAVPAGLAEHHRADVVSDIIMAVLEGEITLADVPKFAKRFITAHHRQAETYTTVSLDAPIGDGKVSMHDFISEGMWESARLDE